MAYIQFLDSKEQIVECVVTPDENVVTLKFVSEPIVSTSGFNLFLDEKGEVDIGENFYHNFKTIFRNDDETRKYNGYQLSSDGSVFSSKTQEIHKKEPTLEELKEIKIAEMNVEQQKAIRDGVDVKLQNGTMEHFTLTEHDQTSLMGLQTKVLEGEENIPWHTSDETEHCKFYSNADMALITSAALAHVAYNVTWFRDLRIYIRSLNTKEKVKQVTYNTVIPEEYRSEPLKVMVSALKV